MFCGNCGTENDEGAKICKNCGKPLGNDVSNADQADLKNYGTAAPQKAGSGNFIGKIKALPKKVIVIVCAAVVALVAILIVVINIVANAGRTINLSDYLTIESAGYDGRGRVVASIDWDAIEEKYGSKISLTSAAKKELGGFADLVSPIDVVQESVSVNLSESSGLSNGDTVEYTFDVDDELTKYVKCNIKFTDGSYTVSGLEAIGSFDPFIGVEISFSGTAPNGTAHLDKTPSDNGLSYSIDNSYNLSNGDIVTVTASYGWISEDNYIDQYGQLPTVTSKEYTVEGLDEYVMTYSDIDESLIADLKAQAEDKITAYTADCYDDSSVLGTLEYVGYAFCGTKPGKSYWSTNNMLYLIYRGEVSSTEGNFDAADIYYPVKFFNLLKNSDGIQYEIDNNISGYSSFSNYWYYTDGYINPLKAYADLAEGNMTDYNVECGDGFEGYSTYVQLTDIAEIDSDYMTELETKAEEVVLNYTSQSYSMYSHVDEMEIAGEYFLAAKNQGTDYAYNNRLYVIVKGHLYSDGNHFDACDVYYPIEFDGIIKLPDGWMYTDYSGPIGYNDVGDNWNFTRGYVDGTQMFSEIVTSNADDYTYGVTDGLKEFGE